MAIKGYWRFNGNANDYSGNGFTGVITGSTCISGGWNGCKNYANTTGTTVAVDYVTVTKSLLLSPGTNDFTYSALFWSNSSYTGTTRYIIHQNSTAGRIVIVLRFASDNTLLAYVRDNASNDIFVATTETFNDSKWHHAVFSKIGTTLYLYVDGKLKGSNNNTSIGSIDTISTGTNIFIGTYIDQGASVTIKQNGFYGNIDTIFMDNGVGFTAARVKNEYSRIKGFF